MLINSVILMDVRFKMAHFYDSWDSIGEVVKEDERYKVLDNTQLDHLVVSTTVLQGHQNTTGHRHRGQEEVYIFILGSGKMEIEQNGKTSTEKIHAGSVVLIEDNDFHKVYNTEKGSLEFICVFEGKRTH